MLRKTRNIAVLTMFIIPLLLFSVFPTAFAADKEEYKPAVIRFADLGGIREWRAEGIRSILIQGANSQWYRATFFSECFDLPWVEKVAFVTEPDGSLKQFSSIIAGGKQCYFKRVEKIPDPDATPSQSKK